MEKSNNNTFVTSRCHQQARSFLPPHCSHVPRYLSTVRYWPPLFPSFLPRALTMPLRQQNNNSGYRPTTTTTVVTKTTDPTNTSLMIILGPTVHLPDLQVPVSLW
ncbi:hypothetical protein T4A_9527 [Trichinella pseudospiralis]|uniref:Uncharacterized protein n=1 Tax=Trichinella pseudospiralis TaxID=6337 RepID=A0A0V1JRA3_TRIPS|nr:hypothetical protein T4A_9527 [Trichinella pseudospiralis]KRZ37518.1 hypothetical protein T4C_12637 [Trichinella pseudospiralis]